MILISTMSPWASSKPTENRTGQKKRTKFRIHPSVRGPLHDHRTPFPPLFLWYPMEPVTNRGVFGAAWKSPGKSLLQVPFILVERSMQSSGKGDEGEQYPNGNHRRCSGYRQGSRGQ